MSFQALTTFQIPNNYITFQEKKKKENKYQMKIKKSIHPPKMRVKNIKLVTFSFLFFSFYIVVVSKYIWINLCLRETTFFYSQTFFEHKTHLSSRTCACSTLFHHIYIYIYIYYFFYIYTSFFNSYIFYLSYFV